MKYYEMIFEVTETLQNGKERRKKVSVCCEPFNAGIHRTEAERIETATKALEEKHYYHIEYVHTKNTNLIFA